MPAMSVSETRRRMRACIPAALVAALAACGGQAQPEGNVTASDNGGGSAPQDTVAASKAPASPAGASAAARAPRFGERQLDHPDDMQMLMLAYRLEGREPPIGEWAAAQSRVAYADEFQRPALLAEERQRLQGIYDGTADVGQLRMNVDARFGEYDAARGGYYLDAFMPGSRFNFSVQPAPSTTAQRIVLQIDNPEELNFWPLDATAAKDVLEKNRGMRDVTLDSHLRITGIGRRGDGPVIGARLSGYAIGSDRYGNPLRFGERRFDPAQKAGP